MNLIKRNSDLTTFKIVTDQFKIWTQTIISNLIEQLYLIDF